MIRIPPTMKLDTRSGKSMDMPNASVTEFSTFWVVPSFFTTGGTTVGAPATAPVPSRLFRNSRTKNKEPLMMFMTPRNIRMTPVSIPGTMHETTPNEANMIPMTIMLLDRAYWPNGVSPMANICIAMMVKVRPS